MAKRDFVDDLETITKACTRLFLDGREGDALREFNKKVESTMTALTAKPELLDDTPKETLQKLNRFQFNHYMEFVALTNNSGIKKKGGR